MTMTHKLLGGTSQVTGIVNSLIEKFVKSAQLCLLRPKSHFY